MRKLLVSLCMVGFVLAGCQPAQALPCPDALGCVSLATNEPIKLGVLQTLSGGSSPAGIEQVRSIELAVAQRQGRLLGHPIELQTEDERCSAEGGANAALRIVADPQTVAILGTNCSSAAVTASKIMSAAGLVMISSANTSASLTSVGDQQGEAWQPGYFRTAWNDSSMGRAAATFAFQELQLTRAAVIHAGDTYSKGLSDVFAQVFSELGGQVVSDITVDEDETEQHPMLEAVARSGAQLLFFPLSHPEAGSLIVRQAREVAGLEQLIFIGGEGMLSDIFIGQVGPAGYGTYVLGPAAPHSQANDQLRQNYQAKYGSAPPSFYYSFAYDAANLLMDKIEAVAVQGQDGRLQIGRQSLREALYATRDYNGLSGRLRCNKFGDCGVVTLNIVRLDQSTTNAEELRLNVIYTYHIEATSSQ